jgi:hypothetical protein
MWLRSHYLNSLTLTNTQPNFPAPKQSKGMPTIGHLKNALPMTSFGQPAICAVTTNAMLKQKVHYHHAVLHMQ